MTTEEPASPEKLAHSPLATSEYLSRFREELGALGVACYVEEDLEAIKRQLALLLEGKSILSWEVDHLPYGAGTILEGKSVVFGSDDRIAQATADIGLTGCDAAIAETGSLVLISGEGKARTASLLPFEHLAIVRRSDIYQSMREYFEKQRAEVARAAYLNIITGPSRTADIELSLTLGVHGPGKLTVVVGP